MVTVVGSANVDHVVRVQRPPQPGETVTASAYMITCGGKGANQAVACARAGTVTRFIGAVGNDDGARLLLASLNESGVHALIQYRAGPTGTAFVTVNADGENSITVVPGANATLQADPGIDWTICTHLLLQLEIPLPVAQAYAETARAAGVHVIVNASPAQDLPDALLDVTDTLIVNEHEMRLVTGNADIREGCGVLWKRRPTMQVIVTLGARGAVALGPDGSVSVPAAPARVVDTTGAGDTFAGVLAAAFDRGDGLRTALMHATTAAGLCCEKPGAQVAMPWHDEIASGRRRAVHQ